MHQFKVALLPGSRGKYGLICVREESLESLIHGAIYACGGIIVLRDPNYINTHTFILSTTHRDLAR